MVDNLLYPLLVATITTVGVGLIRDRGREAVERRIDFYGSDEARQTSVRLSEFQATQRIRSQARLMALDHVRRTAAAPFGFFLVMAGGYLFVGSRELTRTTSHSGDARFWLAVGAIGAVVGAHALLAVIHSFEARGAVIKSALAGTVPSMTPINPLEEFAGYRPAWRPIVLYPAMLLSPSAIGAAAGSLETSPSGDDALLLILGALGYVGIALVLTLSWREMDKAVHGAVTAEAAGRFSLRGDGSA